MSCGDSSEDVFGGGKLRVKPQLPERGSSVAGAPRHRPTPRHAALQLPSKRTDTETNLTAGANTDETTSFHPIGDGLDNTALPSPPPTTPSICAQYLFSLSPQGKTFLPVWKCGALSHIAGRRACYTGSCICAPSKLNVPNGAPSNITCSPLYILSSSYRLIHLGTDTAMHSILNLALSTTHRHPQHRHATRLRTDRTPTSTSPSATASRSLPLHLDARQTIDTRRHDG